MSWVSILALSVLSLLDYGIKESSNKEDDKKTGMYIVSYSLSYLLINRQLFAYCQASELQIFPLCSLITTIYYTRSAAEHMLAHSADINKRKVYT